MASDARQLDREIGPHVRQVLSQENWLPSPEAPQPPQQPVQGGQTEPTELTEQKSAQPSRSAPASLPPATGSSQGIAASVAVGTVSLAAAAFAAAQLLLR